MGITSNGARVLSVGLITTLTFAGAVVTAPGAFAVACDPETVHSYGDLDGDSESDIAVGLPTARSGAGAVDVRGTRTPRQVLTTDALGGTESTADRLGTAVAIGDLDGDGCADLVIGAPGEGGSGQVHIVLGSPDGIDPATAFVIPTAAGPGDRFGSAIALERRDDVHDLYVGSPFTTVSGVKEAGTVARYTLTAGGPKRVTVQAREVRSQNSPGVPGEAEAGDRFGSVLSAVGTGRGVLVGVPREDIGDHADAGALWFLRVDPSGEAGESQSVSQDTKGVPGKPEKGDNFGASVGANGRIVAVGIPREDDGARADSGMVQFLVLKAGNDRLEPGIALTQKSEGIPGKLEAGDRFGATVVVGSNLFCREDIDTAIGSPGEDVGSHSNSGTVTLFSNTGGCEPKVARQGSGMTGASETGDEVGSVLSLVRGRTDADENYADRLLVGVPGEDLGVLENAGIVHYLTGDVRADGVLAPSLKGPDPFTSNTRYGSVLASTSR